MRGCALRESCLLTMPDDLGHAPVLIRHLSLGLSSSPPVDAASSVTSSLLLV